VAIEKKRMQQRYGTFEQYTADKNNLLPNEFASVISGDTSSTDGTALYFKSGIKDPIKVITANDNTFITITNKEDNINKAIDKSTNDDINTLKYPSLKYLYSYFYDYNEIDKLLEDKANTTDITTINSNISQLSTDITNININLENNYYTNDTINGIRNSLLSAISLKYDSSNIELGTATLTPYSTQIDKIKSATCLYEKIGDIVIVNVAVIMNATSLGGTSAIALLNMPFSNKSDAIVYDIGISKNGGMFRGSVNKSAWLQFTPLNKQAYNFVADEQVNFSLIYKI
jgi:hypothetical protein